MIDPSLKAVLRSKYSIRKFFVLFGGLLVLLLVILLLVTAAPCAIWRSAALNFLGNFAATVAIFLVTYLFYVLVTSPGLRNASVIPLQDVEIGNEIVDLPAGASDYWFWGRSGSYFRSAVLPRLAELSRTERKHVKLRVVLPNPGINSNDSHYKHIKRGLGETASDDTLRANVIATIVSVVSACSRNPYLSAEIGLCGTVPVLRYDLSNNGALITRDAKHLPALLINSGNPYFEMFRDAVENELRQSLRISWDAVVAGEVATDQLLSPALVSTIQHLPPVTDGARKEAEQLLKANTSRYA
jgi:hypothetical protein